MSDQDTPISRVDSGPTPAFNVRRAATIPATYVDTQGVSHGDDWPLSTTQSVTGRTGDGSEVTIGSVSSQIGPNVAARVAVSSIQVRTPQGATYSADLYANGAIEGHDAANGLKMNPTIVANLAQYFDNITDVRAVSGATLDQALNQFRTVSGIGRK